MELSDGTRIALTPDQKRIMLVLCNAAESNRAARLVTQSNSYTNPIRETTTGDALVRKGLAFRMGRKGVFAPTMEGFWLGDALRAEDRMGKIPARRRTS